jgi:hypothetical protein
LFSHEFPDTARRRAPVVRVRAPLVTHRILRFGLRLLLALGVGVATAVLM